MAIALEEKKTAASVIEERAAILRRLKKQLLGQKERLLSYLTILEHESKDLVHGDVNKLTAHVEMEQAVIQEIRVFQRVIDPLEQLYQASYPEKEEEIPALKKSLGELTERILHRNKVNRELLRKEMADLKEELVRFRIPGKKKDLFNLQGTSTLIDITT
ncbi:MAG: flagellar export chaperone FlgN [Spirochaetales bacterium]|nr:flagellar export chaperone FlgN [Spirochaetales bacterium]